MNILTEGLPDCVEISGETFLINTDFRVWIKVELLISEDIPDRFKIPLMLELVYPVIPPDRSAAANIAAEFYAAGIEQSGGGKGSKKRTKRIYSFEHDADRIYAAFIEAYGIDLTECDMHWFKFRALFACLPESCLISRVMGWRAMDITRDMPESMKARYKKLKAAYKLPISQTEREKIEAARSILER